MYPGSVDEGVLTEKQALPVMKLSYGGSFPRISSINYILGPLVCSGEQLIEDDFVSRTQPSAQILL